MKEKILVLMVDDEERFRETTQKLLHKKGFDTLLAQSGEDALEKLQQRPDVVILDIKMPGMEGHEALARIKSRHPDMPVIMLTGHGDRPSAREALVEGAFDYLSKPCDIDLLAEKIKEACAVKGEWPKEREKRVTAVMIPITDYTVVKQEKTLQEAVFELKKSFVTKLASRKLMETGHRSLLVSDSTGTIVGILTIRDLLDIVLPEYLSAPKPALADSIEYSPMFWNGMFTTGIKAIRHQLLRDIMSPSPVSIDGGSNLMEAAWRMISENERRLLVSLAGKTVGVIREQDLFFEMERILSQ